MLVRPASLLLVALAACSAPPINGARAIDARAKGEVASPDAGTSSPASSSLASSEAPDASAASAVSVDANDAGISGSLSIFVGLPAISDDGAVIAMREEIPGWGDAYQALEIVNVATDRVEAEVVLADERDPEHPIGPGAQMKAKAILARQQWLPLTALTVEEDPSAHERSTILSDPYRNHRATGAGLAITYHEPTFTLEDESTTLFSRAMRKWSYPAEERCKGCGVCPAPLADIEAVYVRKESRVLVAVISYHGGSDTCLEPPPRAHVVRY